MKLAFVIPWFGFDIPGGAESECRSTLVRLQQAGVPVEVLTTCIKEFRSDWSVNFHSPGAEVIRGVPVRRFKVKGRDAGEFNRINARLMQNLPITPEEETAFLREMIRCNDLTRFIEANAHEYVYIFIPYMFPTSYWGTLAAPERSVLIPCLHDESYAYLPSYRPMFEKARGLVFHCKAELGLARRLYQMRPDAPAMLGEGIETTFTSDPGRFRRKYQLDHFLLYAGRKDGTKNVPLLVDYFCRYKDLFPGDFKLVLIGDLSVPIPEAHRGDVIDLGFVPIQDKYDAYGAALALCQPSLNESFSIVLMESWIAGTPVLVHEKCTVTRDHCLSSSGGLYFDTFEDFVGCLDFYRDNPGVARRMGRNGRTYVLENYAWDRITAKYLQALKHWGFDF